MLLFLQLLIFIIAFNVEVVKINKWDLRNPNIFDIFLTRQKTYRLSLIVTEWSAMSPGGAEEAYREGHDHLSIFVILARYHRDGSTPGKAQIMEYWVQIYYRSRSRLWVESRV